MKASLFHAYSSDERLRSSAPFDDAARARGYAVTYVTPPGPSVELASARGVRHLPLSMTRRLDPAGDMRGLVALRTTFARERPDIVHTHNAKVGVLARLAAAAAGVPVVVHTVHGLPFHGEADRAMRAAYALSERAANVRVHAILTQSEEDAAHVRALAGVSPAKVHVVGNGIDLARFAPPSPAARTAARERFGFADGHYVVVCPARLRTDKGIEELLAAAGIARSGMPNVRVALAGEPDVEGRFAVATERLDRARREGDYVLGFVDDMPALYAAADAVALPSWHEGLPRALMEGAAVGLPVVATDVPGCREIVRRVPVAWSVPLRDARALGAVLERLARERPNGLPNRQAALASYDVHAVAARIVDLYDALLAAKRATNQR